MKIRTRQAIGKQNRARGQAFERTVAKELAKVWPEARRNLSQTRTAKKEGGDILGVPMYVEVKSGKRVNLDDVWSRAFADHIRSVVRTGQTGEPIVVYKDGRDVMVMGYASINNVRVHARVKLSEWLRVHKDPLF